jgi:CHAT domain-containing protein
MSLTSTELTTCLAELEADLSPGDIAKKHPELCTREVIVRLADEVNRLAREDLSRAESLAEVAGRLADAIDDDFCRARAARSMANMKVLRGKNSEALEDLSRALKLFRNLGADIELAATLSSSLQPLIYQGNYGQALDSADEAKQIATRHGDDLLLGRLEINFGNILHRQDRFNEAVKRYQLGLEKLHKLGQRRDCAIALVNLAVCYISLHDFRRAEQAYKDAREISERENMQTIVAQADYNIAYLYYHRGEYRRAIQLYQKTRLYCQRAGDSYHSALCDLDQAEMYLELHLHKEGIQLAEHAGAAFKKMGMSYEATKAFVLLGIGAYQSRRPFQALDLFAKAQDLMRAEANVSWIATLDLYQAMVLQQEGRYYEALRYCRRTQQALGTAPSVLLADTHLLMATLHLDVEQVVEAESWAETATESAQILQSPAHLSRACWLSGRLAERSDRISEACSAYRRALECQDAIPAQLHVGALKIPYSKNQWEIYEAFVSLEIREGARLDAEQIFKVVEKARAQKMAELIRFRTNALPTPSRKRSALVEEVNHQREELNWYYRRAYAVDSRTPQSAGGAEELRSTIQEQERSFVRTLGELENTEQEFHSLVSGSVVPIQRIREQLSEDEVILEFFIVRGLICVGLLQRTDLEIFPLARLAATRQHLRQLRVEFSEAAFGDRSSIRFAESRLARTLATLQALHSMLVAPLEGRLEGKRLIIVPDGPLHYLPFHALFDGERFLSEKYVLSYASSASMHYLSCTKPPCSGEGDFVVGDPAPGQVPSSADRVALRPKFLKVSDLKALEARPSESRFIHLECAIRLRTDNILFSTLSVGNTSMSILDSFHLHLPCDVLGLTGSGTGIGADEYGRELLGLARGLEYAGSRAVLMPLWNCENEPVQMFLEIFYSRAAISADRAEVFQSTIAEVRDHYPHPFHWAPFTLRGKIRGQTPT